MTKIGICVLLPITTQYLKGRVTRYSTDALVIFSGGWYYAAGSPKIFAPVMGIDFGDDDALGFGGVHKL